MKRTLLSAIFLLSTLTVVLGQDPELEKEQVYTAPDLNARATLLVKPEIPSDAALKADGETLSVRVNVDGDGNVVSAKCSPDCPKAIAGLAEAAAMASKFRPLIVNGKSAKYDGTLLYSIALEKVNWLRFAYGLQSTYVFDNLSLTPIAAMLTNEFAAERAKLQALDQGVELAVRWKTIKEVRESIKGKLQGKDGWWFELGFAVRKVSWQFQSDKKLDLNEVQTAISNLSKFVDSAPSDLSPQVIENLRKLSTYKIDPAMPPREVYQALTKLISRVPSTNE